MFNINLDLSAAPHWMFLCVCVVLLSIEVIKHHPPTLPCPDCPECPEPPENDTGSQP